MSDKLQRVKIRPDPSQWDDDELMTLAEAAMLMWPNGPLTETSLRTAVRDRRLAISVVAGKFLVTKAALRALSLCKPLGDDALADTATSRRHSYLADLRAIEAMGGDSGNAGGRTAGRRGSP
ncbi:hypothetical protein M2175_004020 [Bradyrhizobium elkanii]|uniref:hypothetical protein n=1 Tax=Bradyrhizobium TaxID=374 RepID=UPI002168B03F|nr:MULTISPECIES: hypothetical protein [Bradyrhizobium]MCS3928989.1 hypothetical protein [Bradyrhizobium elkanii]MCS3969545.1 hypothetical protein [Bradyrhizobium japonicum]